MQTHIKTIGLACLLTLGYGCQRQAQQTTSGYSAYEKPDTTHGIQAMKDYHYSAEVENGGIRYAYDIVRETNDTLPLVTGDDNEQFADNYIRLRVNRGNQEIFHKVFTKNNFRDYVDHKFLNRAILEGMAFDKCTPEGLRFAVSVCYPGSDIYIPLSVTISPDGSYTIAKDEVLDTVTEADSTLQEE